MKSKNKRQIVDIIWMWLAIMILNFVGPHLVSEDVWKSPVTFWFVLALATMVYGIRRAISLSVDDVETAEQIKASATATLTARFGDKVTVIDLSPRDESENYDDVVYSSRTDLYGNHREN